jgi:primosomal protein N' (replication factor Y)
VEKEIKNFFPGARILRADSQNLQKAQSPEKIYEEFSKAQADILIGTQLISKGWDLPKVALIGIIDADNLLSVPDFLANEKAFQHIVQVAGRAGRPGAKFPGKALLQTFNPDNKLLKMASQKDFISFYQQEIDEREALKLPPFSRLIRLFFQDYNFSLVEKETEKIFNLLKDKVSISLPQDPFVPKIRGRFRSQIIIKIKEEKELEKIKKELENLPNGWVIDIDPVSVV